MGYKNNTTIKKKKLLIKLGGAFLNNTKTITSILHDIKAIQSHYWCVILHGGGKNISEYSKKLSIHSPCFTKEGLRITSKKEMLAVDRILCGEITTNLTRKCIAFGINAVGISGLSSSLLIGKKIRLPQGYKGTNANTNHTGHITECNTSIISILLESGHLPILNPVSMTKNGTPLNINADEATQHIAQSWKSDITLFISDIEGVKIHNSIAPCLRKKDIQQYIKEGIIRDGMITKTRNALLSLYNKKTLVIIGNPKKRGDLLALITKKQGTVIQL